MQKYKEANVVNNKKELLKPKIDIDPIGLLKESIIE